MKTTCHVYLTLQSGESTNGVEEEKGSAGKGYTGEELSVVVETLGIGHQVRFIVFFSLELFYLLRLFRAILVLFYSI